MGKKEDIRKLIEEHKLDTKHRSHKRPIAVTILSILDLIAGVFAVIAGVLFGAMATALLSILGIGFFGELIGAFIVAIGILNILIAYMLWRMIKLGMILTVILSLFAVVLSSIGMLSGFRMELLASTIIPVVISAYLIMIRNKFS